jgi:hypothetical protein
MKEIIIRVFTKKEEAIEYPDIPGLTSIRTTVQENGNIPRVFMTYKVRDNVAEVYSNGRRVFCGYVYTPFACITKDNETVIFTATDEIMSRDEYEAKFGKQIIFPEDSGPVLDKIIVEVCEILDYLAYHGGFCGTLDDKTVISVDKCFWVAGCTDTWRLLVECDAIDSNGVFEADYDKEKLRKLLAEKDLADIENILEGLQDLVQP